MPFLQFTRDKRGYETTSLVHVFGNRQGRTRQRVLYWFRTPPNVKVGRPALDQEAIRWIEEHNPDIEFDWPKILEATPQPTAAPDETRGRRPRRGRSNRPERSARPERRGPQRGAPAPEAAPDAELSKMSAEPPPTESQTPPTPFEEEALEQITHPDTEELPLETPSAVESVLGREQLIRFRARYAELQARIIEGGGEPARVEDMRARADALNPDSWVTVEEARQGLEAFDPKIRELRDALGLRRRRRSRRGGRRRHGGLSEAEPSTPQTASAESTSNSPDASDETDETDVGGEG